MKNLTEISSALAKMYPELTNKKALNIVRSVFALTTQGLCEITPDSRDRVSIAGFGNFGVKRSNERIVKNIKTGEPVTVPAGVRITFKVSDELRKAVLSGDFKAVPPTAESEEAPDEAAPDTKKANKAAEQIDTSAIPDLNDL